MKFVHNFAPVIHVFECHPAAHSELEYESKVFEQAFVVVTTIESYGNLL